ncbi:MAG: terpene cyclase/mutase family protein, partial [Acidimicrobiales bacterium]|nr:terpene cyclase/mutase family protein [Acidimicrobiales bacterium]
MAAVALVLAVAGPSTVAGGATAPVPALPQVPVASGAAQWLGGQLTAGGFIPGSTPGSANLSDTVNALLALAAANVDLPLARTGLTYLEQNANAYIVVAGSDGPGQLANLILAAHALGVDPANFGGTNLVSRLLATEQTSGANTGLFGTDTQLTDQFVGTLDQGLALAALKAAGVAAPGASVSWLQQQQCPDGGWSLPDAALNACSGDPAQGAGPDTNSTALALEGLVVQGGLTHAISAGALTFLENGQNPDGGWAYDPNAPDNQQTSDPDSTSVVIQALLALGLSPDSAPFQVGGHNPAALLLSFRVASGTAEGAFYYPGETPTTGDVYTTAQAVPPLMGLSAPFGPSGSSYWLAGADGGIYGFGGAPIYGSLGNQTLNKPIVGVGPTLDGQGYWLTASDGGVFAFGNAAFLGSMGGKTLNRPVVGMAPGVEGGGYWLVASDGGIFNFGSAGFFGSRGGQALNAPIVGMAPAPDGGGYWLMASDGGVFNYGDAGFHGSMGGKTLAAPIVGIAPTPDGGGYWLV